jgi:ribose transport system ATP-binding protein
VNEHINFPADSQAILTVHDMTKAYQGVLALDNISLSFRRGEIHAIVGENGAGKSTLIKILSGFLSPTCGSFTIDEKTFTSITPRQARAQGIGVIYQDPNLVRSVSVAENVFLGSYPGSRFFIDRKAMEKRTGEILAELGVNIDPGETVENLSAAQMQFVEIAKALVQNIRFLILDEPTAPLTVKDADVLFKLIGRLKKNGVTIIYISHRLNEIYRISDRLTVMRDGRVVTTEKTADVSHERLIYLMVGRHLSESYPERTTTPCGEVLSVSRLCCDKVRDISFSLHKGEILGLAGLTGSGRTEIARMIFGADRKTAGEIRLNGREVEIDSPQRAVSLGIGYLPEDRKRQGVLMDLSVRDNISLPILRRLSHFLLLNRGKEEKVINKYQSNLQIKTPSLQQRVCNLSGGNQQKVALGKWLASSSRILIFDEPTQGIDVGTKYEIYQMMNRLTEQGISIIMISSELEELIGMSDRIVVLHDGRITGILDDRSKFTQETIMAMASRPAEEGGVA